MDKRMNRWNEKLLTGLWQLGNVVFAMLVGLSFMMEKSGETTVKGLLVLAMSVLLQRYVCAWIFKK